MLFVGLFVIVGAGERAGFDAGCSTMLRPWASPRSWA